MKVPDGVGQAWDWARRAVDRGDFDEAERLMPYLYRSDRRLIRTRMEVKRAELEQSGGGDVISATSLPSGDASRPSTEGK